MRQIRLQAPFLTGFDRIRARFDVPERFPDEVLEEAGRAEMAKLQRDDLTAVPFVAIDPPGAVDLDQAFWAEAIDNRYRVLYAIADPAAFIRPGGAVDTEARRRGVTIYAPDQRTPLHPVVLSEDRASLLPGGERPAVVWEFILDEAGVPTSTNLRRAMVRVDQAISYEEAQRRIDTGSDDRLALLRSVGERRIEQERLRGGVSLGLPTQRVYQVDGRYGVAFDRVLPVERWNAQISLLTGMEAARIMGEAGTGIVRTLPSPSRRALDLLRRHARALGLNWETSVGYADFVSGIDGETAAGAAFLHQAARTLRGADYKVVDGVGNPPEHGAIAAPYAHVTAPLRRLIDRFANEILLAIDRSGEPPSWATDALDGLPSIMGRANQRQSAVERAVIDFTEAVVLSPRIGERFSATVVDLRNGGSDAVITLGDHAVVATITHPGLELGQTVTLELVSTDPANAELTFAAVQTSQA